MVSDPEIPVEVAFVFDAFHTNNSQPKSSPIFPKSELAKVLSVTVKIISPLLLKSHELLVTEGETSIGIFILS